MTIKECIDIVDNIKPNGYSMRDKVMWLSFIDEIIINDVLRTHEGYDGRYDTFTGYSVDNLSAKLIVESPYDNIYTAFLEMKIDEKNGETARYNNSMTLFNSYMMEFRKYYNKTHMPLDVTAKRMQTPPKKSNIGISEAEYENLKRDLYAKLSEDVADATSPDKIQDVVNTYVMNNAEMLKGKDGKNGIDGVNGKDGKDGYTPKKGIDYFDGAKGDKGDKGEKGDKGDKGDNGVGLSLGHNAEIFNDYNNNETNIPYAHIEGRNNKANIKGCFINKWETSEDGFGVWIAISDSNASLESELSNSDTSVYNIFHQEDDGTIAKYRGSIVGTEYFETTDYVVYLVILLQGEFPDYNTESMSNGDNTFLDRLIINGGTIGTDEILMDDMPYNYGIHMEGYNNIGYLNTHVDGARNKALGYNSKVSGFSTEALGERSSAKGYKTKATGHESDAKGMGTLASGYVSSAKGASTKATGDYASSEGNGTEASGQAAHTQGISTKAVGRCSHAGGSGTLAKGEASNADGVGTKANGVGSSSKGKLTVADGNYSEASGIETRTVGEASSARGKGTIAGSAYQHARGRYNKADWGSKYADIVGNGTADDARSNAYTLDWDGNAWYQGTVECAGVILKSPNGTRYKITVTDDGTLITTNA